MAQRRSILLLDSIYQVYNPKTKRVEVTTTANQDPVLGMRTAPCQSMNV